MCNSISYQTHTHPNNDWHKDDFAAELFFLVTFLFVIVGVTAVAAYKLVFSLSFVLLFTIAPGVAT